MDDGGKSGSIKRKIAIAVFVILAIACYEFLYFKGIRALFGGKKQDEKPAAEATVTPTKAPTPTRKAWSTPVTSPTDLPFYTPTATPEPSGEPGTPTPYIFRLPIDETFFPDPEFRKLLNSRETERDGYLTEEEIAGIKMIVLTGQQIRSFQGIEYLDSLEYLDINNCQIEELDVSGCRALRQLFCNRCGLTSLTVKGANNLEKLDCRDNRFTLLDISDNGSLQACDCSSGAVETIYISNYGALRELYCSNNPLASLDLRGAYALEELDCDYCRLTELDLGNCDSLLTVDCVGLPRIDLSRNPRLQRIRIGKEAEVTGAAETTKIERVEIPPEEPPEDPEPTVTESPETIV